MATRGGALSQASGLSATRVITPSEDSRPLMRSGNSVSGSGERGHHPPSRIPLRASVGSRRSRRPRDADRPAGGTAVVRSLLSGVMSSAPSNRGWVAGGGDVRVERWPCQPAGRQRRAAPTADAATLANLCTYLGQCGGDNGNGGDGSGGGQGGGRS